MASSLSILRVLVWAAILGICNGGVTSQFTRKSGKPKEMPFGSDVFAIPPGYNAPQQVHITQGDDVGEGVIVMWITQDEPGSSTVLYGTMEDDLDRRSTDGSFRTYRFFNYTSGYIHHCHLRNLKYNTKYYYMVGIGLTTRMFCFITPPEVGLDVPYTFGLIGDLGQSYDSNVTLSQYEANGKGQTLLMVGDLSYADEHPYHDNRRWDTFGRFIERNAAYQPWIWAAGNHEIDFVPEIGETVPFKPYKHRYRTPYRVSHSTSPLWYSIKRASAYIIVLSSYSAYGKYTPQFKWLEAEFPKVNRSETPWLIVMLHSPWYNSYNYHYMEGESMRVMFESWFVKYKVDVVFAGHVHAYERSYRVSNIAYNVVNGKCTPVFDESAPVYITIGDGGNLEGLATNMTFPQPNYSAFREASFGYAMFEIKNRTHAYYEWHRNQDSVAVVADSMVFYNRYWYPIHES
ncbi:Purple acid phosphatase [Zostera marina]|uniref:Purple acid phosphatase n=1 Tax=Zostera marina TaxID=29655 RepID=A0A0K9PZS7_ZOSMR|nr:Purple acid phosphatase [Zostera marina]